MENQGLTKIHLGGRLGQKFGKEWNLYVNSPAEAIRAIDINTGGKLKEYLTNQGNTKYYKVAIANEKNLIEKSELRNPSGNRDIYIMPAVRGRRTGIGKIIAAIVIIIVAYFFPPAASLFGTYAGAVTTAVYASAFSLLIGGVVQLLTPVPSFANSLANDSANTQGSNIFQGNTTAIAQGGAVQLVYGRALVSPMPISISFNNFDQSAVNPDPYGVNGITGNEGGGNPNFMNPDFGNPWNPDNGNGSPTFWGGWYPYNIHYADGGIVEYIPGMGDFQT